MQERLRLQRGSQGWFAAGASFERALGALSDAAFKLFAYACLRASRADGCLEFEPDALARQAGKSRSTLGRCLRELAAKGICELQPAPNQHRRSRLRIRPEYWPYEVAAKPDGEQSEPAVSEVGTYVAQVRRMFAEPGCVQGCFGPADAALAADWQRAGVSLETVRRAILLGSVRKSMSLLDRPGGKPVRSLRYFASLVQEVRTESFPDSYWQHLEFHLRRCERARQDRRGKASASASPNLAQAGPAGAAPWPSSAAEEASKETG